MGRRIEIALALAAALVASAPRHARAEDFIFFDAHPVHPAAGGGFCEVAGAHVHDYAPVDPAAFVRREGLWFFVGDPVVYGYRGTVYRFEGAHEVAGSDAFGGATCSISGVHHHLYAPIVVVAPETAYIPVYPWWWEPGVRVVHRPRPERPHAYDVTPPPPRPRVRPPSPPATRMFPPGGPAASPRRAPPPPARPAR